MPSDKVGSFSEFSSWASRQTEAGSSPDDALAFRDNGKIPGRVFGTSWRRSVSRLLYVDRGKVREKLGVAQKDYKSGSLPRNASLNERRNLTNRLADAQAKAHNDFLNDRNAARGSVRDPIRELLNREYGADVATRVLTNVVPDPNAPVTLSHVKAMDAQLPVAGSFEQIHSHFKNLATDRGLSDSKHLRFKAMKRSSKEDGNLGGLYLHSGVGNVFDYHDRAAKRRAAGREVWRAIRQDHGEAVANRVFRNVFGSRLDGHESDHGVEITLKDLDLLHGELGKAAPFSKITDWAEKYQNARPNLLLRYNRNGDLWLKANDPEWNRADLGSDVEQERNGAGYRVWKSLSDQYGKQVADRIFTKVFGAPMDIARGRQITVGDLRRLELELKLEQLDGQVSNDVLTELRHLSALDTEAGYDAVSQHHAKLAAPDEAPVPLDADALRKRALEKAVVNPARTAEHERAAGLVGAGMAHHNTLAANLAKLAFDKDGRFDARRVDGLLEAIRNSPLADSHHARHMVRVLNALKTDQGMRSLLNGIGAPQGADNPSRDFVRMALNLPPGTTVTAAHAREAALGALLADVRQRGIWSCYVAGPCIRAHQTQPARVLGELKELIETGKMSLPGMHNPVPVSRETDPFDLRQQLDLDTMGRIMTRRDTATTPPSTRRVSPPVWLHNLAPMRAALRAIGLRPDVDGAMAIRNALQRLKTVPDAKVTAEAILEQITLDQVGIDAKQAALWADVQAEKARLQTASLRLQDPDQSQSQRQASRRDVERHEAQLAKKTAKLHPEIHAAMASASAMRHLAGNAFQARIDNRLIQAWEYTVASALEQDHDQNRVNTVVDVVFAAGNRGVVTRLLMQDLSAKGLTSEGSFGDLRYKNEDAEAAADAIVSAVNRGLHDRLAARYRANQPWDDPSHGQGTGAVVLYNKLRQEPVDQPAAQSNLANDNADSSVQTPLDEWRAITKPEDFRTLVAGVIEEGSMAAIEQFSDDRCVNLFDASEPGTFGLASAHQNATRDEKIRAVKDALQQSALRVAARCLQPAFDDEVRRARLGPPPWEPMPTGDMRQLTQRYYGLDAPPATDRLQPPPRLQDAGRSSTGMALHVLRSRRLLQQAEHTGNHEVLLPLGVPLHFINLLAHGDPRASRAPGVGSLETAWKWDQQAVMNKQLSRDDQHAVLTALFDERLGTAEKKPELHALLDTLNNMPRTPNELRQWVQSLALSNADLFPNNNWDRTLETDLTEHAHALAWTRANLGVPGRQCSEQGLSIDAQRKLVGAVLQGLAVTPDRKTMKRIEQALQRNVPRTPAQLHRVLFEALRDDPAAIKRCPVGDAQILKERVLAMVGAADRDTERISASEARRIAKGVMEDDPDLDVPEAYPARRAIEQGLGHVATYGDLRRLLLDNLAPEVRAKELDNSISLHLMNELAIPVPRVPVADLDYEFGGDQVRLALIHNPISNRVEPWRMLEDGTLKLDRHGDFYDRTELTWTFYQVTQDQLQHPGALPQASAGDQSGQPPSSNPISVAPQDNDVPRQGNIKVVEEEENDVSNAKSSDIGDNKAIKGLKSKLTSQQAVQAYNWLVLGGASHHDAWAWIEGGLVDKDVYQQLVSANSNDGTPLKTTVESLGSYDDSDNLHLIKLTASKRLDQALGKQNLKRREASNDGDCFYHAISRQVPDNPDRIREKVHATAQSVMNDKNFKSMWDDIQGYSVQGQFILKDVMDQDVEKGYIKNGAKKGGRNHWAALVHGALVAQTYQRPVVVHAYNRATEQVDTITFGGDLDGQPIRLTYDGVNHFDGAEPS